MIAGPSSRRPKKLNLPETRFREGSVIEFGELPDATIRSPAVRWGA
jgi:hypothetical protein